MQFTIAQLERLVEQGGGIDTSRYQNSIDTSHATPLSPVHIRDRVYAVVAKCDGGVSRTDIAKALKVKKTPWLINTIESLVADCFLTKVTTVRPNGVIMYCYYVNRN